MQSKIYTYNGENFKMKEHNLLLQDSGILLMSKFRKLLAIQSVDIDTKPLEEYSKQIDSLDVEIEGIKEFNQEQLNELNTELSTEDRNRISSEISEREKILKQKQEKKIELETQRDNDPEVKLIRDFQAIASETALLQLLNDRNLIKKTFEKAIEGDHNKLNYFDTTTEFKLFLMKIINDFFLSMN